MMTQLNLEAEIKGQIRHLGKDLQGMISCKLFSNFEALEPIKCEISGLFSMMTITDLEAGVQGRI